MSDETQTTTEDIITPDKPDAPEVITLPPFLLLFALMGGIVVNWLIPMSFGRVTGFLGWLGFIMFCLSFAGVWWCRNLFQTAGTNTSPRDPSTAIVEDGPYEYSRNPIYLCFLIGFAGLSFMADAPMMLALILPLFFVLDQKVIKPEEIYLTDKFGDSYTSYKDKVRRWV